jgi:hypothetical protein
MSTRVYSRPPSPNDRSMSLKVPVVGNEKVGESERWQMIGFGSFSLLIWPPSWINSISCSAHSSLSSPYNRAEGQLSSFSYISGGLLPGLHRVDSD